MKNNCFTKIIYSAFILLVFIPLGTAFAEEGIRTPVSSQEKSQFPYNITYAWNINKEGSSKMRCTGTIIKDNWLLSAAHCVAREDGSYGSWNTAESETNGSTHNFLMKMYKKNVFVKTPFKPMPGYAGYNDLQHDVSVTKIVEPTTINTKTPTLVIYKDLNRLIGKTVTTTGYSRYYRGDFTKTSGKITAVESDGTLTVSMPAAQENSGSAVYLDGEIIGVLTATGPGPEGMIMADTTTVTPFTLDIKSKLFDPNGISSVVK